MADQNNEPNSLEETSIQEKPQGFGWGNIFIVAIFLQWIALGVALTNTISTAGPISEAQFFMNSCIILAAAFGLVRKEKYGLYVTYLVLGSNIIGFLAPFFTSGQQTGFLIVKALVSGLWCAYFSARTQMFRKTRFDKLILVIAVLLFLLSILSGLIIRPR